MLVRCGGAQDGFTVGNCAAGPSWMVPAGGVAWVFCRRHLRSLPRSLRSRQTRYGRFVAEVVAGFATRYGLEVVTADLTRRGSLGGARGLGSRPLAS
jgi:hypothetical protein